MTVIQSSSSSNDPSKTPDTLLQDVSVSIGMAKQLVSSWLNPSSSSPLTTDTSSVSDQHTITSEQSTTDTSNEELARTTQSFSNTHQNKNTIQTASRPSRLGLGAIGKKNPWQSNNQNQGILPHSTTTASSSSSSITNRLDKTLNAMTRKHQLNNNANNNKFNRFNNTSNTSWNSKSVSIKQSMDTHKKPFSHNRYQPMQQQAEQEDDDMECSKYSAIKKHP